MRPINVSLDSVTWELAKQKQNFSQWVRDQLRSEDNKRKAHEQRPNNRKKCVRGCGEFRIGDSINCAKCKEMYGDEI